MSIITPRIASQLALISYEIRKPSTRGTYHLLGDDADSLSKHFDFDLSNGPIKGGLVVSFPICLTVLQALH